MSLRIKGIKGATAHVSENLSLCSKMIDREMPIDQLGVFVVLAWLPTNTHYT
jgi:hypothetical protein